MYLRADDGASVSCSASVAVGGVALMVASGSGQGWTQFCTLSNPVWRIPDKSKTKIRAP
ncbi:hypothetical protein QFZ96_003144 [Paraburkholderia youngii]